MPARTVPLVSGQIYHVFNKTQGNNPLFLKKPLCQIAIDTLWYYQHSNLPMKLSAFRARSKENKQLIINQIGESQTIVTLISYCLMPNHFHLLLRQETDKGISTFMSNVQNSITRFINTKMEQKGHVFVGQYKTVRIESEEQLLHISRYIHLNPFTGYVTKTMEDTLFYPWSSLHEYCTQGKGICEQESILSHFKTKLHYKKFVEDQKEHQRVLANLKHVAFE